MAPTSDPRPEPAPAPAAAKTSLWTRPFDHPILTALTAAFAALAVGMPFLILRIHGNKIDIPDTTIDTTITDHGNEITARLDNLEAKLHRIDLKLTALLAALWMTDLVDAAIEGRLPASEPTEAEPADAPG